MAKPASKRERRRRVHRGIRKKVNGTRQRPRLSVYRSNKHIYAQLIDDIAGHTMVAASSQAEGIDKASRMEESRQVGELLAERAREADVEKAVFDRSGYRYHGRVKALAEGAREGGLRV